MIFCNRDRASAKGLDRAGTIEPSWGDKSIDPATDHVFDQASAADDPLHRVLATKPKKFALARGHEPGAKSLAGPKMVAVVAMGEAVQEHLDALVRPGSQAAGERRPRNDRRFAPMIGHDEHGERGSDMREQEVEQPIDVAFEPWRYIMNRCQQEAAGGRGHPGPLRQ